MSVFLGTHNYYLTNFFFMKLGREVMHLIGNSTPYSFSPWVWSVQNDWCPNLCSRCSNWTSLRGTITLLILLNLQRMNKFSQNKFCEIEKYEGRMRLEFEIHIFLWRQLWSVALRQINLGTMKNHVHTSISYLNFYFILWKF